jgi:hypothetical protein
MNSDSGTLGRLDHDVFAEESPMMRYVLCLANAAPSRMLLLAHDGQGNGGSGSFRSSTIVNWISTEHSDEVRKCRTPLEVLLLTRKYLASINDLSHEFPPIIA